MKSVVLSLLSVITLAFTIALRAQVVRTAFPMTAQQRDAEILELRQELNAIYARLGLPTSSTQPGLPITNINPAPNGRENTFDSYASWNVTPKLIVLGETDYVVNRNCTEQRPGRVAIGGLEAKYDLSRNWCLDGRAKYFDNLDGLFSGTTQTFKEVTLVVNHQFASGLMAKAKYQRDFPINVFFSPTQPVPSCAQTTAELDLVFWWGMKQSMPGNGVLHA